MRYIGIDVGFGYTKATDGIRNILFPSVISPPVKMGFRPFQGDPSDRHDFLINHLSVSWGERLFSSEVSLSIRDDSPMRPSTVCGPRRWSTSCCFWPLFLSWSIFRGRRCRS